MAMMKTSEKRKANPIVAPGNPTRPPSPGFANNYGGDDQTIRNWEGADPNADEIYSAKPVPTGFGQSSVNGNQATTNTSGDRRGDLAGAYQEFLGRAPGEHEYTLWEGNDDYRNQIQNSPEAQARSKGEGWNRQYGDIAGMNTDKLNNPDKNSPKYQFGRSMQEFGGWGRNNLQGLLDYHNSKYGTKYTPTGSDAINTGIEGWAPIDIINGETGAPQWLVTDQNTGGGGQGGGTGTGGGGGGTGFPTNGGIPGINGGTDPFGSAIQQAILRGLGGQENGAGQRFESIRENIERGRKAQTNQAMAALGDRGLLSEGRNNIQGTEINALNSIEDTIAPIWAGALRDAELGANEQSLGFVNAGSQYQGMVAGLALQNLDQNRMWNQFLAEHGLNRERLMYELQNGNIDQITMLLKLFLDASGQSAEGFE